MIRPPRRDEAATVARRWLLKQQATPETWARAQANGGILITDGELTKLLRARDRRAVAVARKIIARESLSAFKPFADVWRKIEIAIAPRGGGRRRG